MLEHARTFPERPARGGNEYGTPGAETSVVYAAGVALIAITGFTTNPCNEFLFCVMFGSSTSDHLRILLCGLRVSRNEDTTVV
jgi:hypothetical protein